MVKNLPTLQEIKETWVQALGQEDPLEEEMAILFSIFAGKSYGRNSLAGYSPWVHTELDLLSTGMNVALYALSSHLPYPVLC